eukprot:scaffold69784_cov18-Tisochrysis_lutea.AAC.1
MEKSLHTVFARAGSHFRRCPVDVLDGRRWDCLSMLLMVTLPKTISYPLTLHSTLQAPSTVQKRCASNLLYWDHNEIITVRYDSLVVSFSSHLVFLFLFLSLTSCKASSCHRRTSVHLPVMAMYIAPAL